MDPKRFDDVVRTWAVTGSRRRVIGGMLAATFLAIPFVPMFFKLVTRQQRAGTAATSTETSVTG